MGHDGTTGSNELHRVGKKLFGRQWGGVHASDEVLKPSTYPNYAIYNLSARDAPDGGTHWVARYAAGPGEVYWYDSYARPISRIMPGVDGKDTDLDTNANDQTMVAKDCGQRSLSSLMIAKQHGVIGFLAM